MQMAQMQKAFEKQMTMYHHHHHQEKAVLHRRDFSISGRITDTDRVSLARLLNQLAAGQEKGYHDTELIHGVIKAIASNMSLHSYLEGRRDMTLDELHEILRSHYGESDSSELYQELCLFGRAKS